MLIEDDPKSNSKATDEDKECLGSSIFDIDVDLKECVLMPGTEVLIEVRLLCYELPYFIFCRIGSGML